MLSAPVAALNSNMFSERLLDHFQHPRNAGTLPSANVKIEVINPVCGDILQLAAQIENNVVKEIRFLCRGCTASIACASLLTESARGKELNELSSMTPESLAESLGGIEPASFHAANLAHDALQSLILEANKAKL